MIGRLWRRIRGLHQYLVVAGTKDECKMAQDAVKSVEDRVGMKLKREVRLRFVDPTAYRPSRTLRMQVGVRPEPRLGIVVVGCAEPSGRACYVVRQPDGAKVQVLEHEIAECVAIQNGVRVSGMPHTPKEWKRIIWGWV